VIETLLEIVASRTPPKPWDEGDKIPWHEPEFSRRMLRVHLSQAHDWASRRRPFIDRHVRWIHEQLGRRPGRILDLACGPGLYCQALARLGHGCVGVDFAPASIDYARARAADDGLAVDYRLEDVRSFEPEPGGFDLVMMVFGEFNVFRSRDAQDLLHKAATALRPGGRVVLEVHTFAEVERMGRAEASGEALPESVFSERAHLWLQENAWDPAVAAAVTRYLIVDAESARVQAYAATTKAYHDSEYRSLMAEAGFREFSWVPCEEWPPGAGLEGRLQTLTAQRSPQDPPCP
jgi:2-polyprenyl-3-methyl-5-hydroxy-6-metoxy-1,4-benzoquinol methylase